MDCRKFRGEVLMPEDEGGVLLNNKTECWMMGNEGESCREVCARIHSIPARNYQPGLSLHLTSELLADNSETVSQLVE